MPRYTSREIFEDINKVEGLSLTDFDMWNVIVVNGVECKVKLDYNTLYSKVYSDPIDDVSKADELLFSSEEYKEKLKIRMRSFVKMHSIYSVDRNPSQDHKLSAYAYNPETESLIFVIASNEEKILEMTINGLTRDQYHRFYFIDKDGEIVNTLDKRVR